MSPTARRIALLLLMLTLPFHGWALAFAPACEGMSSTQVTKHPCCAEKNACADHKATQSKSQSKTTGCSDGAACQCSSAVSMLAQPLVVSTTNAPATPQIDFHVRIIYAQSAPPFRPPIYS